MKKLLNTVYVTSEGASLRKDGENLVAEVDGAERARVPFHMLASVVVFGAVYISPALMAACAGAGITLVLLERNGRFQARVEGPVTGNVLLRRAQYRASDVPEEIVRSMLLGKVANQRSVLMRALRDHGEAVDPANREALADAAERLAYILRRIELADSTLDVLRGSEGEAANIYFSVFDHLIRPPDAELRWSGRSRRPPLDPVNALLSFLYTLLTHDCRSACESVGLDPAVGFLHRDRPGRPSLALDLMEELRPVLCDRLALSLTTAGSFARRFRDARRRRGADVDEARRTSAERLAGTQEGTSPASFLEYKAPLRLVPICRRRCWPAPARRHRRYPPWFWK